MTGVTGRRAGHDESPLGPRTPPAGGGETPAPRSGGGSAAHGDAGTTAPGGGGPGTRDGRPGTVAPQPRVVPGRDEAPVEVEPTTGAPVDAVPRRVPVRQPRGPRADQAPAGSTPEDDSFFWAPIEQVHWDGTPLREQSGRRGRRPSTGGPARRRTSHPGHPPDPVRGLAVLLSLSLVAAFFAWVSAGPLWLAVGHATAGTVVITECSGGGLTQRCRGIFAGDGDRFLTHGLRVSGVPAEHHGTGTALPARVTGAGADTAYVDTGAGRHLRWLLGLLAVAGCGAGIVRWTGATRLADHRQRRWATAGGYAGPALITLGFLIAAW
ncbi:hypothetical protein [Micromonospora sp. NPDC092111]|uniref:hypothetical protein n=1 Tax=Micromonospora sp. NPDC092111 TaxID=3364289 RepID=UPI0038073A6C